MKEFDNIKLSVRCYSSGRRARCLLIKDKDSDYIISLEENFESDGGLTIYSRYGLGTKKEYKYNDMNKNEIATLPYFIRELTNDEEQKIKHIKIDNVDIDVILNKLAIPIVRRKKLKKLNNIENL